MKNPARVAELLAELHELADNDFERHRIDVLKRDLTAPPVVEVIDDKNQKFGELSYYRQKSGHYVENLPLHRAVWAYYNGEIPDGCNIHHRDGNPANNAIDNLQCLTVAEHRRLHNATAPLRQAICQHCGKQFATRNAGGAVSKFCSDKCRDAHKFLVKESTAFEERICVVCGKKYKTEKRSTGQTCCYKCRGHLISVARLRRKNYSNKDEK